MISMRVQHNVAAMNSYRNYNNNTRSINKNLEKLSSGYKINRAGDDAAGLAISEKMRAQITGLEGAQKNAKDGIGLIQTAEGALTEVHSMLNRMYDLAEQSANGTYDDNTDRASLQMELDALGKEIDRIGTTANFNGKKLFDGSDGSLLKGGSKALTLAIGEDGASDNLLKLFNDNDWAQNATVTALFTSGTGQINNSSSSFSAPITKLSMDELQIKVDASTDTSATTIQITTATNAQDALGKIKDAITAVSAVRGQLGAYQNRLEHTINNLGVMQENIQDAESTIRDTDVAAEMMKYTKNSILVQSAQAMLAQANQQPQGVLQLLQ
jgi:flagellin